MWRRVLILELRPDGSLAEGENENLVSDLFFFFSEAPNLNLHCGVTSPLSPPNSPRRKVFSGSLQVGACAGAAFALRLPQGVKPDKD